jgi:formylglycine-generating enzyme
VSIDGKWGYADRDGRDVIPCSFDLALPFREGLAAVMVGERWGFADVRGRLLIDPQFDLGPRPGVPPGPFSCGLARVYSREVGGAYYIDKRGKHLSGKVFQEGGTFCDGLAYVRDSESGLYGYIDTEGNYRIRPQFRSAGDFSEGLASVVTVDGDGAYVDLSGQLAIVLKDIPQIDRLGDFHGGYAFIRLDDNYRASGYIDRTGHWLWRSDVDLGAECPSDRLIGSPVVEQRNVSSLSRDTEDSAVESKHIVNSVGMKMVRVEAGDFMMGSQQSGEEIADRFGGRFWATESDLHNEQPRRRVRITRPFFVGVHEVTREKFAQFIDAERRRRAYGTKENGEVVEINGLSWRAPGFEQTGSHPVVLLSWNDAVAFCEWLSRKESRVYRLPTEAEWEYIARGGSHSTFPWGDDPDDGRGWSNAADLSAKDVFEDWVTFSWSDGFVFTAPVGSFRPNEWGLYDVIGNVWEWCSDLYAGPYEAGDAVDPVNLEHGLIRVLRGGSWRHAPVYCRSSVRYALDPEVAVDFAGFRIVRIIPDDTSDRKP